MRNKNRLLAAEFKKALYCIFFALGTLNHIICDACKVRDKLRYRPLGVYKYIERFNYLKVSDPHGTYLDYPVLFVVGACGFKVKAYKLICEGSSVNTCEDLFIIVDLISLNSEDKLKVLVLFAYAPDSGYSLGERLNTAVIGDSYCSVTPVVSPVHKL